MAMQSGSSLDGTFHALGDASRRRIVTTLISEGRCSAGELGGLFESSQPTISKHLRVLETAGLVTRQVEGRQHFFSVQAATLRAAQDWMTRHLNLWEQSLLQLDEYLAAQDKLQS